MVAKVTGGMLLWFMATPPLFTELPHVQPLSQIKNMHLLFFPGSKSWFTKTLITNLRQHGCRKLLEPFAGGAVCGLTALVNKEIDTLVLVEKDKRLALFWQEVFTHGEALAQRVLDFPIVRGGGYDLCDGRKIISADAANRAAVLPAIEKNDALSILLRSACQFKGVMFLPAGIHKFGRQNKQGIYEGVASWWDADKIAGKIRQLFALRKRVLLFEGDALAYLADPAFSDYFAFVDPPYNGAGRHLYSEALCDYKQLFDILLRRSAPWLATVDALPENLRAGLFVRKMPMRTTTHILKEEDVVYPAGQAFY